MIYQGRQNEYFEIQSIDNNNYRSYRPIVSGAFQLLWFLSDGNELTIDGISHIFNANQIISLSQHHNVEYDHISAMTMLRFNQEFYCVLNHDSEVGCKGILYYTPSKIPVVLIEGTELMVMNDAWDLTHMELEMKDSLQLEMLQMQLKRILILCTRMYRSRALWGILMTTSTIWCANSIFWLKKTLESIILCQVMQPYCISHPRPSQIPLIRLEKNRPFRQSMTV